MDSPVPHESIVKSAAKTRRKQMLVSILILAAIASIVVVFWYLVWSKREVTSNAYVSGYQLLVSAQVSGTVRAVYVEDTEPVNRGQLLVELDADDALMQLEQAKAQLIAAVSAARQQAALIKVRETELRVAEVDLQQLKPLAKSSAVSEEILRHARDRVDLARTALDSAKAIWIAGGIADQPQVISAKASYIQASINVDRTRVVAPVAGTVAQRTVEVGQQAQAGVALMRLIPSSELWIDANFKETQLTNVRVNQPAEVTIDLYGGSVTFKGHVAGFSAGTGSTFALLPPQNAAGNWVKIVQRVPVRIELDQGQLKEYPLRLGLSARVRIDTRDRSGSQLRKADTKTTDQRPIASDSLSRAETEANRLLNDQLSQP